MSNTFWRRIVQLILTGVAFFAVTTVMHVCSAPASKSDLVPARKLVPSGRVGEAKIDPPMAATIKTPRPEKKSGAMLGLYNEGRNMRAFVDYAMKHPEVGGYFYAVKVLDQCRGLNLGTELGTVSITTYLPKEDAGEYQKRVESADRLRARCADFLQDEFSDQRTREIARDTQKQDPLIQAENAYLTASADNKREALETVLRTRDPALVDDLGARLMMDSKNGRRGFYVNGEFHGLDSETDVGLALYLLPCALGLQCDAAEFDTSLRCATGNECDANRFEYAKKMKLGMPGAYEKVIAVYEALSHAAAEGNTAAFMRP